MTTINTQNIILYAKHLDTDFEELEESRCNQVTIREFMKVCMVSMDDIINEPVLIYNDHYFQKELKEALLAMTNDWSTEQPNANQSISDIVTGIVIANTKDEKSAPLTNSELTFVNFIFANIDMLQDHTLYKLAVETW